MTNAGPKHGSIILYVHGNQKAPSYDGQLRTSTSTLTQLLNYDQAGSDETEMPFKEIENHFEHNITVSVRRLPVVFIVILRRLWQCRN